MFLIFSYLSTQELAIVFQKTTLQHVLRWNNSPRLSPKAMISLKGLVKGVGRGENELVYAWEKYIQYDKILSNINQYYTIYMTFFIF